MTIDLNCDLAEGTGIEERIMPFITSANIACGFHAGDPELMAHTVRLCMVHDVAIGAHPSYPDRENFGRTNMQLSLDQVSAIVAEQVALLLEITRKEGGMLRHVKPHGALYNMAAQDPGLAAAVVRGIRQVDASLVLFGLSGCQMAEVANHSGTLMAHEVFADRTYQSDGTLTPRSRPDALVKDTQAACDQALFFAQGKPIRSTDGHTLLLQADTICLHGDGAHALDFAQAIRTRLEENEVQIKHFNHAGKD